MEPTIKYETCEDLYADDQQDSTVAMNSIHGQYYGERSAHPQQQLHLQQQHPQRQPTHPQQTHAQQAHAQSGPHPQQSHAQHHSHQRQPHSDLSRQRPTHPDFAHLRQSTPGISQARSANAEHAQIPRQANPDHSQTRQIEHPHARQSHAQMAHSRQSSSHPSHHQNHHQYAHNIAMKRSFHDMENGYSSATNPAAASASASMPTDNNAYYPAQGMISVAPHTQNFDIFNHAYPTYDAANNALPTAPVDGKSPKRYKKGEASLLFSPPFFKILPLPFQLAGMVSPNHKDAIAAQCYACGRIVRGNKSISSNFIKHMKRSHPEISKIYDTYKIFRIKAGIMPNIAPLLDVKMEKAGMEESVTVPEDTGDSNEENSPYFDPTSMLDVSEMIEEDNHSENSDNADDSMPSGEPSENNEHSKEPQPPPPTAKEPEEKITSEIPDKMLEAISKLMDRKLKQFVKRSELPKSTINTEQVEPTESNKNNVVLAPADASAVADLRKEVDQLKQECMALRLNVQQSQASKRRLQQELQTVDKMLHQRKLIIRHLKITDPADPLTSVQNLFTDKLGLENVDIVNCSIIPSAKTVPGSNRECVIVELQNPKNCKAIFRETHKLKDTGIFIESEISPFQRKRKNKLMVLRKELLRRKPDIKVMVRNTTLVVNGKNFYWDDAEGLCHTGNKEALEFNNGTDYLKSLTELDLKEFVSILKNYDVMLKE